jgi:hypothetical protein
MASKLEKFSGSSPRVRPAPIACAACLDRGFTGCPEAITDLGDLICIAFARAVACTCPQGAWFADAQREFMK